VAAELAAALVALRLEYPGLHGRAVQVVNPKP
jgi:hypothetical protein